MPIRPLDWQAAIGQKVRVYRNLNNGTISVQQKVEKVKEIRKVVNGKMTVQLKKYKDWAVTGHVTNCIVRDVNFHISEAGRLRVIKDQSKNVHAWGEGFLVGEFDESIYAPIGLAYNPYTDTSFLQRDTQNPIAACLYLVVRDNWVFCSPDAVPGFEEPRNNVITFPAKPKSILELLSFYDTANLAA